MRRDILAAAAVLTLFGVSGAAAQTTVIERDRPAVVIDRDVDSRTVVERDRDVDCSTKTVTKENELGDRKTVTKETCD